MIQSGTNIVNAKVIVWYFKYAAIAFAFSCVLLFLNVSKLNGHYFVPSLLAITHSMSLAWLSMLIFGASFQLLPVLSNSNLYSNKLLKINFYLSAISLPFLIYKFYFFEFDLLFILAASVYSLAVIAYFINVLATTSKSDNIHSLYILSASVYLLITVLLGFSLALNFRYSLLLESSLYYIKLHSHIGILGWFLFLIIGVSAKLIPMFFISKYSNDRLLNVIFYFLHSTLLMFILTQTILPVIWLEFIVAFLLLSSVSALLYYVYQSYKNRIKKKVENTMMISAFSFMVLFIAIIFILVLLLKEHEHQHIIAYGVLIFFGWLSLLSQGMTFKTLPFIVWNNVYKEQANTTINPKDLYSLPLVKISNSIYLIGLAATVSSVFIENNLFSNIAVLFLCIASIIYCYQVFKVASHKAYVK